MKRPSTICRLLVVTAFALAACSGGGGGLVSMPPPPVTPTPTPTPAPAIVPAATSTQQFAGLGAVYEYIGIPQFDAAEQLQVRYVASSNSYEVQHPHSQAWSGLIYDAVRDEFGSNSCGCSLVLRNENFQYSRHFVWQDGERLGLEVVGMPTPESGVPISGSANYGGPIHGFTTELTPGISRTIGGAVSMTFNFGSGSLSGNFSPILNDASVQHSLGTLTLRDTVYSTGSPIFSGKFDANLLGFNSFNGLFTGPSAQELMGNFAFPYQSPLDSQTYQASGVFIGSK